MKILQILLEYDNIEELRNEFENNLSNGGVFVETAPGVQSGDECEVVLVHPDNDKRKTLPSMVTLIIDQGENKGMGIAFNEYNPTKREALHRFIEENAAPKQDNEKMRLGDKPHHMSEIERANIARYGDTAERIQLERRYGKLVWELLLRNPRITRTEVCRIAKRGALPSNLRQMILSNRTWLQDRQIRHALLTNPKLSQIEIKTILKASTKDEVRVLSKQGAASPRIRREALSILAGR